MTYAQVCREHKFNRDKLREIEPLFSVYSVAVIKNCYNQMEPGTFFICKGGGLPYGSTYWFTVIRTQKKLYFFHSEALESVEIENDGKSYRSHFSKNPTEARWKEMFMDIGRENFDLNHYDYLHLVIDEFWKLVFGKTPSEMFCGGIIGAHGDKAYGYDSDWEEAGVPFGRGVLLFLLTYTKELGDTPKHESCQWVIDNYQKYLPHIEAAEKAAGFRKGETNDG